MSGQKFQNIFYLIALLIFMIFVVPFDGSNLAEAALTKAKLYAIALDEAPRPVTRELFVGDPPKIVAVSVIPEGKEYAQKKGWIDPNEEFRPRSVAEQLHRQVTDIAPSANYQSLRVDRWAPIGTIASRLRKEAIELGATDVFIGSENAGRLVTAITSIGSRVAADENYDVHIIRKRLPPKAKKRTRSEFFVPE
jgi:hypothetical protein